VGLQTFRTHSRLTLRIDEGVDPTWKDIPGGFELILKGLSLSDLGAPLGEEDAWVRQKTDIGDSRLASMTLSEVPGAVVVSGKWKLPAGDLAPADPRMERFDYRQKSPARFVVDFWLKDGPTLAQVRAAKSRQKQNSESARAAAESKLRKDRKIASVKEKTEREDLGRFCRQPSNDENDVSLAFTPAREPIKLSRWFPSTTADTNYIYLEPKDAEGVKPASGKSSPAQYVKLALDLYRQGKPALSLRTIDFFETEHPQSEHRHEMTFLRANCLIRLHREDEALSLLKTLTTDAKDTPVALHSAMFIAGKFFEKQNNLQALETSLWLISNHSDHRLAWVFHLGAAEALAGMKQTERAAQEYQWVAENAPDDESKTLGAFRVGDLYLERLQYEQALAAYYRAAQRFSAQADAAPYVQINRAETLFWLKDYARAGEAFHAFLTRYPSHPIGWRAAYRLAETASKDVATQVESRKWFYDTVNRYPYSPGATLARLKLLPCGDHGGMTADSALRFFAGEAAQFRGKYSADVVMARYQDLVGLVEVRALIAFGREEKAVEIAIHEIRSNVESVARPLISDLLQTVFRKKIIAELEAGREYEALKFYQENVAGLPRTRPGYAEADPDYLLKLSRAASKHGLAGVAEKLSKAYDDGAANHAIVVAAAAASAGRSPASEPKGGAVEDPLKTSERAFTEAKARFAGGDPNESAIRKRLAEVVEESEFSYGRELILGLLDQRGGKLASALSHAIRAQLLAPKGSPKGSVEEGARLGYWVASLQAAAGESKAAIEGYRSLSKFAMDRKPATDRKPGAQTDGQAPSPSSLAALLGVAAVPTATALILAEGELLAGQGRWGEAAQAYSRAVEENLGGNQALFEYARALGKTGETADRTKSQATLKKLASSETDDFWRKLAREALANQETSAKEGRL